MTTDNSFLFDWEARFVGYWQASGRAAGGSVDGGREDGSHDLGHFRRVWRAAAGINREEGGPGDELTLLAAAYFHDIVSLPKNDPRRGESSRLSAEKVGLLLVSREFADFPPEKIPGVCHAIHAHSFSAGVACASVEAKILQDADRLEALGAIGVARVFYTAGQLGAQLFDAGDPLAAARELDDRRFALDHFAVKLLKLPGMMHTAAARRRGEQQAAWMRLFIEKLCDEVGGDY